MSTAVFVSGGVAALCFAFYYLTRGSKYVPDGFLNSAFGGNPNILRNPVFMIGVIAVVICILVIKGG